MNLIIGGHPRSGTSLLARLCDAHPEIAMTFEFGNYLAVGRPYDAYQRHIIKRLWMLRLRGGILANSRRRPRRLSSYLLALRYLVLLHQFRGRTVDAASIETILRRLFPGASLVGDKYPGYVFHLDELTRYQDVKPLIIYRDGRDVANSTLRKARGDWRPRSFSRKMDTADKVARRWIEAIELMEKHEPKAIAVRYEDLVQQPGETLTRLAESLDVDPSGFDSDRIRDTSVGKYRHGLTRSELNTVIELAGATLERMGYAL